MPLKCQLEHLRGMGVNKLTSRTLRPTRKNSKIFTVNPEGDKIGDLKTKPMYFILRRV